MKKRNRKARRLAIGFVMDPMDRLDYEYDSSISLMMEAARRGHETIYVEPKDICPHQKSVFAQVRHVSINNRSQGFHIRKTEEIDLRTLDAIFNRKDPPVDLGYLYLTQILELLEPDVFIINSPAGVRRANEKLICLNFPDWIPPTLVSNQPGRILSFQDEIRSDVVVKPLNQKGGTGIRLLPYGKPSSLSALKTITQNGNQWIMAQKFLDSVYANGDKRILLLNGNVLGCFRRIPRKGEFRANLCLGGDYQTAKLTKCEQKLVRSIAPWLVQNGLYFAGIDTIGRYLIEINVTSPAGITILNELEGKQPEVDVINFLEERASI